MVKYVFQFPSKSNENIFARYIFPHRLFLILAKSAAIDKIMSLFRVFLVFIRNECFAHPHYGPVSTTPDSTTNNLIISGRIFRFLAKAKKQARAKLTQAQC